MAKTIETVCIVDDDDIYQFVASMEIKKTKMVDKIIFFADGEQAINYLKQEQKNIVNIPDIIFLDVNMPVMDGWQFLAEYGILKSKLPKSVIIYLVSSSVDERDLTRAKTINEISGYLIKPVARERLLEVLNTVLN